MRCAPEENAQLLPQSFIGHPDQRCDAEFQIGAGRFGGEVRQRVRTFVTAGASDAHSCEASRKHKPTVAASPSLLHTATQPSSDPRAVFSDVARDITFFEVVGIRRPLCDHTDTGRSMAVAVIAPHGLGGVD